MILPHSHARTSRGSCFLVEHEPILSSLRSSSRLDFPSSAVPKASIDGQPCRFVRNRVAFTSLHHLDRAVEQVISRSDPDGGCKCIIDRSKTHLLAMKTESAARYRRKTFLRSKRLRDPRARSLLSSVARRDTGRARIRRVPLPSTRRRSNASASFPALRRPRIDRGKDSVRESFACEREEEGTRSPSRDVSRRRFEKRLVLRAGDLLRRSEGGRFRSKEPFCIVRRFETRAHRLAFHRRKARTTRRRKETPFFQETN